MSNSKDSHLIMDMLDNTSLEASLLAKRQIKVSESRSSARLEIMSQFGVRLYYLHRWANMAVFWLHRQIHKISQDNMIRVDRSEFIFMMKFDDKAHRSLRFCEDNSLR